jgi:hypothetical protein
MYQAVTIEPEPPMVALSSHPRFPFELFFHTFNWTESVSRN